MTIHTKLRNLTLAASVSVAMTLPTLASDGTNWDMPIVWPDGNFHTKNARVFAEEVKRRRAAMW